VIDEHNRSSGRLGLDEAQKLREHHGHVLCSQPFQIFEAIAVHRRRPGRDGDGRQRVPQKRLARRDVDGRYLDGLVVGCYRTRRLRVPLDHEVLGCPNGLQPVLPSEGHRHPEVAVFHAFARGVGNVVVAHGHDLGRARRGRRGRRDDGLRRRLLVVHLAASEGRRRGAVVVRAAAAPFGSSSGLAACFRDARLPSTA